MHCVVDQNNTINREAYDHLLKKHIRFFALEYNQLFGDKAGYGTMDLVQKSENKETDAIVPYVNANAVEAHTLSEALEKVIGESSSQCTFINYSAAASPARSIGPVQILQIEHHEDDTVTENEGNNVEEQENKDLKGKKMSENDDN